LSADYTPSTRPHRTISAVCDDPKNRKGSNSVVVGTRAAGGSRRHREEPGILHRFAHGFQVTPAQIVAQHLPVGTDQERGRDPSVVVIGSDELSVPNRPELVTGGDTPVA